jgi:phytoene dehydrogenase-like protein
MAKSIAIIGSGLGGLAAGIYGQMNGFDTHIYEMHSRAGGQCASWKRKDYTFDVCIHHLMGCSSDSKIYQVWSEIGAFPTEMVYPQECVSVASPDGRLFIDYYDLDKLEKHLNDLSPQDKDIIHEYVEAIRYLASNDLMGEMIMNGVRGIFRKLPTMLKNLKWFKLTMREFAKQFKDPFLQKAFPLLVYSNPDVPVFVHLMRKASGLNHDIAWPVGASSALIDGITARYLELGGKIDYRSPVSKILTKDGKACGIKLKNGTEAEADIVISNADGRNTLLNMLDGKFMDERLRGYCGENNEETNWAVHVFLGVNRDLSDTPSSMVMLLEEPVTIAGHELSSLELQIYSLDKTMAPEGKSAIKVELYSTYDYWSRLSREEYLAEKEKTTKQVIDLLERQFPGISGQVEAVDVPTLLTWERFMGGYHGFANTPKKEFDIMGSFFGKGNMTVPGLSDFYFTGVWATSAGATFMNALSGKKAIQSICKKEHIPFQVKK